MKKEFTEQNTKMKNDFQMEIKIKDMILKRLNAQRDKYDTLLKQLLKMIEYPRLLNMANRMLYWDRVELPKDQEVNDEEWRQKHLQAKEERERQRQWNEMRDVHECFSPAIRQTLLECLQKHEKNQEKLILGKV